jgi:hypothetical protein
MFIVTTTPDARPSSVGAAWMGILAPTDLRQWPSEREYMPLRSLADRAARVAHPRGRGNDPASQNRSPQPDPPEMTDLRRRPQKSRQDAPGMAQTVTDRPANAVGRIFKGTANDSPVLSAEGRDDGGRG